MAQPEGGPPPVAAVIAEPRDRVLDAVKACALGAVILGHALAWDITSGRPANVVDGRPGLAWTTWVVQVLPLFFAVGGVSNLGSWQRHPGAVAYARRRLLWLGTPTLVYSVLWTAVLLPLAVVVPEAQIAGSFLAQLTWFLGVYAAAVVAVPWTSRWVRRPVLTLGLWLGLIALVDVVRFTVHPLVGWLNLLLVWGWLHQLGYHLPALRRWPLVRLLGLAAAALVLAVGLVITGPYSWALVNFTADPERSNFAPPSIVLDLYGLALVLVLAAAYRWLTRATAKARVWRAIGPIAARAMGLYLWHIPWVGLVAATAWATDYRPAPLSGLWWLAHALGLAVVLPMTWVTAGFAGRADRAVVVRVWALRRRRLPTIPLALLTPGALLLTTITGYATWGDRVFPGVPSSTLVSVPLLAATLWGLAVSGSVSTPPQHPPGAGPGAGPRAG